MRGISVLICGHLNSLFAPRGGYFNKKSIFKSSNARGGGGGMLKLQFHWFIMFRLSFYGMLSSAKPFVYSRQPLFNLCHY